MTQDRADVKEDFLPPPGEAWTPIRLTRWSGAYLKEKGIDNGRLNAELMLARVLDVPRLDLYLQFERPITPQELKEFKGLLVRRAAREPLQYVLGVTPFRELDLTTDQRALIPRPETEVLVEEVLGWVKACVHPRDDGGLVGLEVGTGSGAVALSLLEEGPVMRMVATDLSREALDLARENAQAAGLDSRVDFRQGALFEPIRTGEQFHIVVSNPPYVPLRDRALLAPEVRDWEPPAALFAGPEGLDVLLPLIREAPGALRPGGLLALEVGEGQGAVVLGAAERTGAYANLRLRPDLAGKDRIFLGVAAG